jgi:F0F1-type ATP synthase membrane subunit b/b'
MADAAQEKARKEVRRAQADYERKVEQARDARRKTFERAQKAGMSLREIAKEVDLHWTRVGQILKEK